jgi:hypothetical protein
MRSLTDAALGWMASMTYLFLTLFALVLVVWLSKRSYSRGNAQRRRTLLAQLGITDDDERGERRIAGFFHPYWSVNHPLRRSLMTYEYIISTATQAAVESVFSGQRLRIYNAKILKSSASCIQAT